MRFLLNLQRWKGGPDRCSDRPTASKFDMIQLPEETRRALEQKTIRIRREEPDPQPTEPYIDPLDDIPEPPF